MKGDETSHEFNTQLNDIVNSSINLGEKIPKNIIFKKIMRSLPERFRPKVITMRKAKTWTPRELRNL